MLVLLYVHCVFGQCINPVPPRSVAFAVHAPVVYAVVPLQSEWYFRALAYSCSESPEQKQSILAMNFNAWHVYQTD